MLRQPQCSKRNCKYFTGVFQSDGTESTERPACLAYPEGIPDEIAYGEDLHQEIRDDQDNDIIYEKR